MRRTKNVVDNNGVDRNVVDVHVVVNEMKEKLGFESQKKDFAAVG